MEKITGEGSKPIFNRKEIIEGETAIEERTVRYIAADERQPEEAAEERREKDSRKLQSRALMEKRSYRDRYLDKSNEGSREKRNRDRGRDRDRDRDREPMDVASHS